MSVKVGDVLWMALQCAKSDRQSLIDAYHGDKSQDAVREASRNIRDFERLQLKLFGTTRSRGNAAIDKMKPVDLFKLMSMSLADRENYLVATGVDILVDNKEGED